MRRQEASLYIDRPPVAHSVPEQRMLDLMTHATLECTNHGSSTLLLQLTAAGSREEVTSCDFAVVDDLEHQTFGHQRSKFLRQVQRQGGSAEARSVKDAEVRIEADRSQRRCHVFDQ